MALYGVFHATGILLWYYYFVYTFLPQFPELTEKAFEWIFMGAIPVAYVGARLMDHFNGGVAWDDLCKQTPGLSFYGSAYILPVYAIGIEHFYHFGVLKMLDALSVSCCFLIVCGRLANYAIGELKGCWSPLLKRRHPNQLYECFGEGILPFVLLKPYEDTLGEGRITLIWTYTYAVCRIFCEFCREDDEMPAWYRDLRHRTGMKWLQVQAVLFSIWYTLIYFIYFNNLA